MAPEARFGPQTRVSGSGVPRRGVFSTENYILAPKPDSGVKNVQKKIEIEGAGLSRRDPRRNSASDPGVHVENGGMATHLVTNLCDLGSVGVPAPARTPLGFKPGCPGAAIFSSSSGRCEEACVHPSLETAQIFPHHQACVGFMCDCLAKYFSSSSDFLMYRLVPVTPPCK